MRGRNIVTGKEYDMLRTIRT